ncbi:MAG: hypothetical protein SH847_19045 [Roseiflexaceae bacterium]|nr:hypothetical protein [Roseiflexaceae bacterium]
MTEGKQPVNQSKASVAAHHAAQEQLLLYATILVQGHNPAERYPQIAAHLIGCSICRSELEELLAIGRPVFTGELPQVIMYPPADLSFLRSNQRTRPWWIDMAGHLIIVFSESLLNTLGPPLLIGNARGRLLYDYIQESGSIPGVNARIEVFAVDQQPDMSCVRVFVEILSRDSFDQHGSVVRAQAEQLTWQSTTDESGTVSFEPVPLSAIPYLRIEIAPAYTATP